MSEFKSWLTPYIEGLIAEKRARGYLYREQEKVLRRFERMLTEQFPDTETITKEIAEHWATRRTYEKTATIRNRMTPVSHLALYMNRLGHRAFVFPTNTLGHELKYPAHIYNDEELKRFFHAVDTSCHYSPEVPFRHLVMPLLFRMLYCCGLRPGEPLRLKVSDVDLQSGVLKIMASKYDSDRLVPMSASLQEMCCSYVEKVHADSQGTEPFFPGYGGKPITSNNLNANFRRFLYTAGISHGGRGTGPRIYDFRHTFAVNCLKQLVLSGASMNAYYPILKTYMGHSFFKYTAYYLSLTKNMFPDICMKLSAELGDIIPGTGGNGNA